MESKLNKKEQRDERCCTIFELSKTRESGARENICNLRCCFPRVQDFMQFCCREREFLFKKKIMFCVRKLCCSCASEGLMNENYCRSLGSLGVENCCWSMDVVISRLSFGWFGWWREK